MAQHGKIQNDNAIDTAKLFNFDAYSSALADIISSESTDTPLTIGIFGDWGSGKTSLMSTIQKNLEGNNASGGGVLKVKCIWFNAWEQSFGQGGMLTTGPSLLYHIYKELVGEKSRSEKIKDFGKKVLEVGVTTTANVVTTKYLGCTIDELKSEFEGVVTSRAILAESFRDAVNDFTSSDYQRVVVFIDDMDRCLPESAVELLEAIKLFLKAKNCIFVLGVDKRVIIESIRVRYKDFTIPPGGAESPITGDNYLEKIIQLSFQLPPIRTEDIEGFITELDLPKFYEPYIGMISKGIEQNPRKVKRFLNNLELQRTLASRINEINEIFMEKRSLFEALLVEWAIINSYYPIFRKDVIRDNVLLAEMHRYVKEGDDERIKTFVESGVERRGLKKLIDAFPDEVPTEDDVKYVIYLSQATEVSPDEDKPLTKSLTREEVIDAIETKKDLSRANVSRANLRGLNLSGVNLSGADLSGARLMHANLKAANMQGCILAGADMRSCKLWRARMENADMSDADLRDAEFFTASLNGAIFENSNLKGTSLLRTDLRGARFEGAEFLNTNLDGATLEGADFRGADIDSGTIINSLKKARLRGAMFDEWVTNEFDRRS
ncbi:MAG: hypothetical protein C4B59_02730 [Candidatus Methanogaster sp.]|uniref:Uncharacterized protein n=1 Tax=Candidatus Methanogaster sp. TaxID=3386292 RepID=A0AC61L5Z7_9EURY|nr:MAG: hypothetical protein C4B59_02730 [ANME-2 cluster archaeon]